MAHFDTFARKLAMEIPRVASSNEASEIIDTQAVDCKHGQDVRCPLCKNEGEAAKGRMSRLLSKLNGAIKKARKRIPNYGKQALMSTRKRSNEDTESLIHKEHGQNFHRASPKPKSQDHVLKEQDTAKIMANPEFLDQISRCDSVRRAKLRANRKVRVPTFVEMLWPTTSSETTELDQYSAVQVISGHDPTLLDNDRAGGAEITRNDSARSLREREIRQAYSAGIPEGASAVCHPRRLADCVLEEDYQNRFAGDRPPTV